MSKTKTTMKNITERFHKVFRIGYCDLQNIFKYEEAQYYNSGVYGWNCDIYADYNRNIAICSGYRNMRGERIPSEIFEKYDTIAKNILKNTFSKPYTEIKEELDKNREEFLNELNNI